MAKQSNYPNRITNLSEERPSKLLASQERLLVPTKSTVLFGTNPKDHIEMWVYNTDGTYASKAIIPVDNPALKLTTVVDNTGIWEFTNINIADVANKIAMLDVGTYTTTIHFFRNEVGSAEGNKLVLTDISTDRTEIKLKPFDTTEEIKQEILDFVTPSIPKLEAQGLLAQTLGVEDVFEETTLEGEVLTIEDLLSSIEQVVRDIGQALVNAGAVESFELLFKTLTTRIYRRTIDNMKRDIQNYQIQRSEFLEYIDIALVDTIREMQQNYEIDPRFEIV
jgi:hypothetical protein